MPRDHEAPIREEVRWLNKTAEALNDKIAASNHQIAVALSKIQDELEQEYGWQQYKLEIEEIPDSTPPTLASCPRLRVSRSQSAPPYSALPPADHSLVGSAVR